MHYKRFQVRLFSVILLSSIGLQMKNAWAATPPFTIVQVERGRTAYVARCASCHGVRLEGRDAPAIRGPSLAQKFGSAARLYDYLSTTMPPSAPGQLGEQAYLNITAFILDANGARSCNDALTVLNLYDGDLAQLGSSGFVDVVGESIGHLTVDVVPQAATWGIGLPGDTATQLQSAPIVIPDRIDAIRDVGGVETVQRPYIPVSNAMLLNPPHEEWLMWRRTFDSQGYSPLDQINRRNVADLELAWAWPMAEGGQQQTAPLVHNGVMFLATTDNIVQALDAVTGDAIWEYRHAAAELPPSWGYQRYQARRQKGSIALYEDKVILATADARLVALDAHSGRVIWQIEAFNNAKGYGYTVGPLVVRDKIISGISGCSIAGTAGGCFIAAHDVHTGRELWRFNVLDDPENPAQQASWGGVPVANRWGGSSWATGSYDPDTNTTFWGTGQPGPYPELLRGSGSGAVLYTNSTLALDADSGERRWHYQHLPRDNWDMDSPFERVLVDERIDGRLRRLLVTVAGKNGIAFALDRDTGKFLWARETIVQNVVAGIDEDGTVHTNEQLVAGALGEEKLVCPSLLGGKSWQAGAYSPLTKAFYVPLAESCSVQAPSRGEFTAGNYVGSITVGPRVLPSGVNEAGVIEALDVTTGKQLWRHSQRTIPTSSLLATGGGLLFGGDAGRYFMAFDQATGELLWRVRLNAPIGGHPMTYQIDGVQYLAVPTGYSAQAGSAAALFPETPLPSGAGNSLFVFKLRKLTEVNRPIFSGGSDP